MKQCSLALSLLVASAFAAEEKQIGEHKTAAQDFALGMLVGLDDRNAAGDGDLLLVLGEKEHGGLLEKSVEAVYQGEGFEKRERDLQVNKCMGCENLEATLMHFYLKKEQLPVAIIFPQKSEHTRMGKFLLDLKGIEDPKAALTKWISAFDDRRLKPWIRSSPEPKEQSGPVMEVVGSTFDKKIVDAPKHVVLLVYAAHNASSKPLQQTFEKIGTMLQAKPIFRVAQFAWGDNEYPPMVSLPFPDASHIYLFRKDDRGDIDHFPMNQYPDPSVEAIFDWLRDMLPDNMYGLDSFFNSLEL
jgi:hypothetical protein